MKKQLLSLILTFSSSIVFCQIKAVVIDRETTNKIPYVNIWVENQNIGTTSNENGEFILHYDDSNAVIVFSAIGFATVKIKADSIRNTVAMEPQSTELQEVIITPKTQTQELTFGHFDKSKINMYFGCHSKPVMVARYFEFKEDYHKTPFLSKIKLLTKSNIKNATFNIRLYAVNDEGEPEGYIYSQNIMATAKKGKKITEIDLSKLHIEFPEKGLFIALEWLIIESNKHEYTYTYENSKKKHDGISYEPAFGAVHGEDESCWIFRQGSWMHRLKNTDPEQPEDKYNILAIELTLTN